MLNCMLSNTLLDSEDEGVSQLLMVKDFMFDIIESWNVILITNTETQKHENLTA